MADGDISLAHIVNGYSWFFFLNKFDSCIKKDSGKLLWM